MNSSALIVTCFGAPSQIIQGPSSDQVFPLQNNWMGMDREALQTLAGFRFDGLMGVDIRNHFDVLIDPVARALTFSPEPLELPQSFRTEISNLMGVPLLEVGISAQPIRLWLDTGAKISYLRPQFTANYPAHAYRRDFYPGFGTPIHRLPISPGPTQISIDFGHLPPLRVR